MQWDPEAEAKLQQMQKLVPLPFRNQAEKMVRKEAEKYAEAQGKETVDLDTAIIASIHSTPGNMRSALRQLFKAVGIDPEPYAAHFNS